jgi:predicted nucleic acid-binding protein
MTVYFDTSALVKLYLREKGTDRARRLFRRADIVGASGILQPEMNAALAKAVRADVISEKEAAQSRSLFREDWTDFAQLSVTSPILNRASGAAWSHGLRGYDAVHLAAALAWNDGLGTPLTFATFDQQLWHVAGTHALTPFPDDLPALIDAWATSDSP